MRVEFLVDEGKVTYSGGTGSRYKAEVIAELPVGSPLIYCLEEGMKASGVWLVEACSQQTKFGKPA